VRGGGIIVSISGREEKLRVLSSKPDRYVFDDNLNKRIHDAQRRPWGAHRTETRVGVVGREVPRSHELRSWGVSSGQRH
jgi:hypothetical protein